MSNKNEWVDQGVVLLNGLIDQANVLAEAGQRAEQIGKQVFEIRDDENTEDAVIKKFQTNYAKGLAQLQKWQDEVELHIRTTYAQFNGDAEPYDADRVAVQYKALKDQIGGTIKALETLNGGPVENVTDLKNLPGQRKSSATGQSGIKRPRLESVQFRVAGSNEWVPATMDIVKDGKVTGTRSNLTAAGLAIAKIAGKPLSAGEIQTALFAETEATYNTKDLTSIPGKEIVFVVSCNDKNFEIQVVTQSA